MNPPNKKDRLLVEVLEQDAAAAFHGTLLDETLRLARRRRVARQVQRVGGILTIIAIVAALFFWQRPHERGVLPEPYMPGYQLTLSQPLSEGCVFSTRPFAAENLVSSAPTVQVVSTTLGGASYRELGDDELLALAPQPAVLIRRGPREAELVLVAAPATEAVHQN